MTAVLLLRRSLVCAVAICVAATGLIPPFEAVSIAGNSQRACCCSCPGECQCGNACACLTPQPVPAKTSETEKADPRVKTGETSVPGIFAARQPATTTAVRAPHSLSALARFPSLRTLEVRIQT